MSMARACRNNNLGHSDDWQQSQNPARAFRSGLTGNTCKAPNGSCVDQALAVAEQVRGHLAA